MFILIDFFFANPGVRDQHPAVRGHTEGDGAAGVVPQWGGAPDGRGPPLHPRPSYPQRHALVPCLVSGTLILC